MPASVQQPRRSAQALAGADWKQLTFDAVLGIMPQPSQAVTDCLMDLLSAIECANRDALADRKEVARLAALETTIAYMYSNTTPARSPDERQWVSNIMACWQLDIAQFLLQIAVHRTAVVKQVLAALLSAMTRQKRFGAVYDGAAGLQRLNKFLENQRLKHKPLRRVLKGKIVHTGHPKHDLYQFGAEVLAAMRQ